jgi:hypothetical protein
MRLPLLPPASMSSDQKDGSFSMVGVTLNAFDASVPGREEGLD